MMNQKPKNNSQSVAIKDTAKNYASLALGLLATAFGIVFPQLATYPSLKAVFWIIVGLAVFSVVAGFVLSRYTKQPELVNTKRKKQFVNSLSQPGIEYTLMFLGFVGVGVALISIGTIAFVPVGIASLVLGYVILIRGFVLGRRKRSS